jgi:osmotically-inducible protein OsmY
VAEMQALDVRQAVVEEIAWDSGWENRTLVVTVYCDEVTLAGLVVSFARKIAAERAALRVPGVARVRNHLKVDSIALDCDPDDDIASMAYLTLRWDADVPDTVKAYVRSGYVTLAGTVERQSERAAAEAAVSRLRGVRGIENRIFVSPGRSVPGL